jgi:pyridoxine/pyridoxamine 5'-phosphate oxidase
VKEKILVSVVGTFLFASVYLADAQLPANVEAPANALGYYIDVTRLERLELANDRVHSRRRFERDGAEWTATELIP